MVVEQEVSGSGNQSTGQAESQNQTNNNQCSKIEIHISVPPMRSLFAFHAMHITIDIEPVE